MVYRELAATLGKTEEDIAACVETARRSLVPETRRFKITENGAVNYLKITRQGVGPLITAFGVFHHFSFIIDDKWERYSVLVSGDLSSDFKPLFKNVERLLLRTDSGCETGQLFGDRTCECGDQLQLAMKDISTAGEGVLVSIPTQDGRGLGLPFKLATLRLQKDLYPLNTVQASALLEPPLKEISELTRELSAFLSSSAFPLRLNLS